VIRRGFRALLDSGRVDVDVLPKATPGDLHRAMEASIDPARRYDVLHFIGHGEYDAKGERGYLLFENDRGGVERLRADVFRQIVGRRGTRLVFLNACETGSGMRGADVGSQHTAFAAGVAPMLVRGGVPTVVANQFKVLDPAAVTFASHFYRALADGHCVGDAAREARVAVRYSITGESIDWAVPVVFARNPGDRLVSRPAGGARAPGSGVLSALMPDPVTARVGAARSRGRLPGAPAPPRVRVALWDINHVVPALDAIAARLNAVQRRYAFDVVDVSAPLGTWRLRPVDGEGDAAQPYLYTNETRQKLAETPARLGVDWLFCITSFWMTDGEVLNLYADSGKDDSRIVFVSTAGLLARFAPPATSLERMVANLVAAFLSGLPDHRLGEGLRPDCPAYLNPRRSVRLIGGRLRFCACAGGLRPRKRAALDAILAAFDGGA
jgi:hypothetical protein